MQQVTRQLEQVRRRGRALLLTQRLCQWLTVVLPVALGLALLDYALRLPGVLRLALGLALLSVALLWISTRLIRAWHFAPGLPELALRLERVYPQLKGHLASAVEFHLHQGQLNTIPRTAALARSSVEQTRKLMDGVQVGRLIDPSRTGRLGAAFAAALIGFAAVASINPHATATAASRWISPLGDAAWPKRTHVNALAERTLWPIDTPLPLRATIDKGYHPGMRVSGSYRIINDGNASAWQEVLLTEQAAGDTARRDGRPVIFERLIELPPSLSHTLTGDEPGRVRVEFQLAAGDDQTDTHRIELAARPAVTAVTARLTPPAYATGLAPAQSVAMHEQTGQVASASALVGAIVELDIRLNKPLPLHLDALPRIVAGFSSLDGARVQARANTDRLVVRFPLRQSAQSAINLTDAHGLSNHSQRAYRIEAIEDNAPAVTLTEPTSDQSVLPTAIVELAALAQDDVGVEELTIEGMVPDVASSESRDTAATITLARQTGRQATLEAARTLDLTELELEPGDRVELSAVAQDVFDLMGARHQPVRSTVRTLKIIDETELAAQVRTELATVRQQTVRLEQNQAQAQEQNDLDRARSQQTQVSRRITGQDEQIARLEQRVQSNRLDDPGLTELMRQARELLDAAEQSSDAANQSLDEASRLENEAQQMREADGEAAERHREAREAQARAQRQSREASDAAQLAAQMAEMARNALAEGVEDAQEQQRAAEQAAAQAEAAQQQAAEARRQAEAARQAANQASPEAAQADQRAGEAQEQARQQQQAVRESLNELAAMLDQGANALALQQELRQITEQQQELAEMTRQLLPRTAGLDREDLPEDLNEQLEELTERQRELAQQSGEFARNARQAAETMRNQGETDRERATAESLEEAADIAERQGLEQDMQQASEAAQQNQLSQAGGAQADAQQTLSQMSQAMEGAQQRQQELLRRRLAQLAQLLENLLERQRSQLTALAAVDEAAAANRLPDMAPAQTQLRQATMAAEAEARTDPSTEAIGDVIASAVEDQGRAVVGLRDAQQPVAQLGEEEAIEHLEDALEQVNQAQQEQAQQEQEQQREELRKAYEALAEQQQALRSRVAELAAKDPLDRREQAALRTHGNEQEAIRKQARELGEQVQDTLVFNQTHTRIDTATNHAAEALLRSEADPLVLLDQAQAAKLLRAMAEALAEDDPDEKFEQPPGDESGGGGGGGGGGEEPLITDVAELKLLKGAQEAIYDETRALGEVLRDESTRRMIQRVEGLGEAQADLHEMGRALIEKVQRQGQIDLEADRTPTDDGDGEDDG